MFPVKYNLKSSTFTLLYILIHITPHFNSIFSNVRSDMSTILHIIYVSKLTLLFSVSSVSYATVAPGNHWV